jgi:hypothetical protein
MISFLPAYELSLFQRLLLIWLFIICGLVLGLQASQHYADKPSKKWFLTPDTKYACHLPLAMQLMRD